MPKKSNTKKKCGGKVPYYNIASDPSGYKRKKKNNKRNKTAGTKRKSKKPLKYTDDYENTRKIINKNKKDLKDFERKINNRGLKLSDIKDIDLPTMDVEVGGKSLGKDVRKALSTGVGVAEDIGSLGMKVGKTAIKDIEGVGKRSIKEGMKVGKKSMKFGEKMLTMKKKKKGKSTKGSYRKYLSKRLKEVKKAHPSWPQSKVFKEAVKGWKSSK